MKLTERQKRFADLYVENGGNVYKAAVDAGYSEKYANAQGYKLLGNVGISEYIKNRMAELESARIMTVKEALEHSTSIARGEPQKFKTITCDPETKELETEERWFSPKIEERQKSLEHILRVNGAFIDKAELSGGVALKVEVDYGDSE